MQIRRSVFGGVNGSADLKVESGRDVGADAWRLELTPYLLRDANVRGEPVNVTLDRPLGTLRSLPGPDAGAALVVVACVAFLRGSQRRP